MKKVELYANMGELAHEYNPIYSIVPGEFTTKVIVEIPDKYEPYENQAGDTIVKYNGTVTYLESALNTWAGFRKECKITEVEG